MTFPKLVPAFTVKVPITPPSAIGSAKTGGLNHVGILSPDQPGGAGGGLVSEPGYAVSVRAQFVHGADYIRPDPDGKHLRLSVTSTLKTEDTGAFLSYSYTGTITLTPAIGAVLSGAPDAATTPFGDVFTHVTFETGDATLQVLEHKVFVAAGRFIVTPGQPVAVEYKISEVTV